jgi:hypothetical protein
MEMNLEYSTGFHSAEELVVLMAHLSEELWVHLLEIHLVVSMVLG